MNTILTEKEYQAYIIQRLLENGYALRTAVNYDRLRAMDPEMLFQFLEATQPKKIAQLKGIFKENFADTLLNYINAEICKPSRSHTLQ